MPSNNSTNLDLFSEGLRTPLRTVACESLFCHFGSGHLLPLPAHSAIAWIALFSALFLLNIVRALVLKWGVWGSTEFACTFIIVKNILRLASSRSGTLNLNHIAAEQVRRRSCLRRASSIDSAATRSSPS